MKTDLGHSRLNLHAIMLEMRILVPLEHANTVLNGLKALLWTSHSELNHRSGLERLDKS